MPIAPIRSPCSPPPRAVPAFLTRRRPGARQPAPPTPPSATRSRLLPEIKVSVTRTPEPLSRVPFAVGVVRRAGLSGPADGRPTRRSTICPASFVANRYNFSLDQRISIRGAGSRSNFGVRGLKILLDGVPQTLPDGQSQLTNVDFADLERARGAARPSSSFSTATPPAASSRCRASRAGRSSFAQTRAASRRGTGRHGSTSGRAGARGAGGQRRAARSRSPSSRPTASGSTARPRSASSTPALDYVFSGDHDRHRATCASAPTTRRRRIPAPSPSRVWRRIPTPPRPTTSSAAPTRTSSSSSSSLGLQHRFASHERRVNVTVFGLLRDLENPLAAPPPGDQVRSRPPAPSSRSTAPSAGARASGSRRLGSSWRGAAASPPAPTSSGMRDDRQNFRSLTRRAHRQRAARPAARRSPSSARSRSSTGRPDERLLIDGGVRYDWVTFDVEDHHLSDDGDNSGSRRMMRPSGNIGVELDLRRSVSCPTSTSPPRSRPRPPPSWSNQPDAPAASTTRSQPAARGELRGRRPRGHAGAGVDLLGRRCSSAGSAMRSCSTGGGRAGLLRQRGQDPQRRRRGRAHRHADPQLSAERRLHLRPLPLRRLRGAQRRRCRHARRQPASRRAAILLAVRRCGRSPALRVLPSTPTTRSAPRWPPTTTTRSSWPTGARESPTCGSAGEARRRDFCVPPFPRRRTISGIGSTSAR